MSTWGRALYFLPVRQKLSAIHKHKGDMGMLHYLAAGVCRKTSDVLKASVICRATCGADWSLSFYQSLLVSSMRIGVF